MSERLLTVAEVAERLHVHINTVRRWLKSGELQQADLPGRTVRIPESQLQRRRGGKPENTEGDPQAAPDA